MLFASNFPLSALGMWAYASHPKIRKCDTLGLLPNHSSKWVLLSTALHIVRLSRYTAHAVASAQVSSPTLAECITLLADSRMVRLYRYATPFCSGVLGVLVW